MADYFISQKGVQVALSEKATQMALEAVNHLAFCAGVLDERILIVALAKYEGMTVVLEEGTSTVGTTSYDAVTNTLTIETDTSPIQSEIVTALLTSDMVLSADALTADEAWPYDSTTADYVVLMKVEGH